jgi:predicted transcriptional regulator of viral defense system
MESLKNYIVTQLGVGGNFFTKQNALKALNISQSQFKYQAYRLAKKRMIKRLANDFYMIIPPEYYHLGGLPPLWFIDQLMKYLGQEYYVGLLTASSLYGATEQQPMVFQVVIDKRMRSINLKRGLIEFHTYRDCKSVIKTRFLVPTGFAYISDREQTMLDLIRFYKACGYMSNVALVIKTLAEKCNPQALEAAVKNEKSSPVLQRLGYILEYVDFPTLAEIISLELQSRNIKNVLLRPDFHDKQGKRLDTWKLIINDTLEIE